MKSKYKKFRKKPIIVTAYKTDEQIYINTLEGKLKAMPGDWIVIGINGELYPVKPDIFEKTYDPVEDGKFKRKPISKESMKKYYLIMVGVCVAWGVIPFTPFFVYFIFLMDFRSSLVLLPMAVMFTILYWRLEYQKH